MQNQITILIEKPFLWLLFYLLLSDNNDKETLITFKNLVDEFLQEIKIDDRVEYCGFISASEYINKNKNLLGEENYDYVLKRYISNNFQFPL